MRLVLLRNLHFIYIFTDAIKLELLTLTFKSGIVRISAHIKPSPSYYKANTLTVIFYSYTAVYSVNSNYLFSRVKQEKIVETIL